MAYQLSESKLWKALTAVASSIMTSLLYDLVSRTSYIIHLDNMQYILIQGDTSAKDTVFTIAAILLVFFLLWGIFTVVIHVWSKVSRQLRFRKIKFISGNILVNVLNKAKERAMIMKDIFCNDSGGITDINIVKLQFRELADIICNLNKNFVQQNQGMKAHMKDNFRNPKFSTVLGINNGISKYEFLALIELLNKMLSNVQPYIGSDELMKRDYKQMLKMLDELKDVAASIP